MKKNNIILTIFLCFCAVTAMVAQEKIAKGTIVARHNVLPDNYNFWLYTPGDYDPNVHPVPLVFYLHGASCCGYDLNKVRRYGTIDAIAKGKIVPAIVIAPQTRGAWSPKKLNDLLEWAKKNFAIDTTRVYVLGMSLGGYGTMDFVNAYPEKIAAAIAFCGGCSAKQPDGLGKTCLWIMHGTADRAVGINCSKRVVEYLQKTGQDKLLRYDWMQGGSHGVYARCFFLQKTYDWLFSHSLKDKPRKVDTSFEITREDIQQTYSELKWFKGMFEND